MMERAPLLQRKDAILAAACDQFGRHGFRGASLRDIAREAGVSLTLLNHHFENKAGLLAAVIAAHRPMLKERADELQRLRDAGPGVVQPGDLVHAWATMVFDAATTPDGSRFLRFLARMADDASEEAIAVKGQLGQGREAFVDALQDCLPCASRQAAVSALLCVDASLLGIAANIGPRAGATDAGLAATPLADGAWLERFLVAGIDASLSEAAAAAAPPAAPFSCPERPAHEAADGS